MISSGILGSGRDLTRDELEMDICRDQEWSTKVAPLFNDASHEVVLKLIGKMDGFDPSAKPIAKSSSENSYIQ